MAEVVNRLSEDMIVNILSRLPVKYLLQYRCVSKSLSTLLRSPYFITKHLNHFNQLPWNSCYARTLVGSLEPNTRCAVISILNPERYTTSTNIQPRFLNTTSHIIGLCNGIICLTGVAGNISLWNFATKEFKCLPHSQVTRPPETIDTTPGDVGFGFDRSSNDYKVLRTVNAYREDYSYSVQVELYKLSTDSWRELDITVPATVQKTVASNTFLNGSYHWWGEDDNGNVVLSFDMEAEVFHTMSISDHIIPWPSIDGAISVMNKSLALIVYPGEEESPCIDVWVMKDYGNEQSWSKIFVVGPVSGIELPLGFGINGELFYESRDRQLVVCDPATKEIKRLQIYGGGWRTLQVLIYTESLVPLEGAREDVTEMSK